jgi:hypothetical protein
MVHVRQANIVEMMVVILEKHGVMEIVEMLKIITIEILNGLSN